jgi:putative two-component system response regulator
LRKKGVHRKSAPWLADGGSVPRFFPGGGLGDGAFERRGILVETAIALSGRVLLVGCEQDLPRLASIVDANSWALTTAHSPRDALRCVREDPAIDIVILVPGESVGPYLELCRSIKFDRRSGYMSVVLILPVQHADLMCNAFEAGADDCICANALDRELLLRLLKAMRVKRATDSLEDSAAVILALANAIEGKDHYTCGHVERVGMYAVAIGREVGVDPEGLTALKTGGVVHDIGKIGIPDQVLNKPGKLTDEEMEIMRRHPVIGYDILQPLRTFRTVLPIVRWHHERPNGEGYPDRLKNEQIPLLAKITAVADCFDALSTDRPYRPAFALPKCRSILEESAARGELDGDVVKALFHILNAGGFLAEAA